MTTTRRDGTADRIVTHLGTRGPTSRKDLAAALGLPQTTIASAAERLVRGGVVHEQGIDRTDDAWPGRGRPPRLLALTRRKHVAVVVVGHHTLQVAVVASDDGTVEARAVRPLAPLETDDLVQPSVALLDEALAQAGLERDVVGCAVVALPRPSRPGRAIDAGRRPLAGAWPPGPPQWFDHDPVPDFERALGVPTVGENDANLAALGEATRGVAAGAQDVLHLKLVPGLGAGVIANGAIVRGALGYAGELGHVQVDEHGPLCGCGNRGCVIRLVNLHMVVDQLRPTYPSDLDLDQVLELAAAGEPDVCRILGDLGRTMAPFVATACLLLNPEVVVVDGSLGIGTTAFMDGLRDPVVRSTPREVGASLRIAAGTLHDQAELVGAAALATRLRLAR